MTYLEITNMKRPVGRPKGHKLSQETKDKIALGRTGKHHSEDTKDKISDSVSEYHRKDGIQREMCKTYKDSPEAIEWINEHKELMDEWDDVIPDRKIWSDGNLIDRYASDNLLYGIVPWTNSYHVWHSHERWR